MTTLAQDFDGSGREPRPHQIKALNWIDDTWAEPTVSLQCGTGTGKSGIGVSVIRRYKGIYIVPTNALMDQLIADYPDINYIKGQEHYPCSRFPDDEGITCGDAKEITGETCTTDCLYQSSIQRCLDGEPTFANPFSYFYIKRRQGFKEPTVLVVDEAHELIKSFMLMSGITMNKSYGEPDTLDTVATLDWLSNTRKVLEAEAKLLDKEDLTAKKRMFELIRKISSVYDIMYRDPQMYTIFTMKGRVNIKPIRPPKVMVQEFFKTTKAILMSATLTDLSVKELMQERHSVFKEFGTPIPLKNRQVRVEPSAFAMNFETSAKMLSVWIKAKMKKYPGRNTIVHMTYSDVERVKEHFPNCIANTKETKTECVRLFKQKGGLFLAAGCGTGIDLKYNECRLNLIPRLLKPNLNDEPVKKRKSLADGETWFKHQIAELLVQQAGRSTRSVDDESITVVGDKNIKWLVGSIKEDVNQDFIESVRWK